MMIYYCTNCKSRVAKKNTQICITVKTRNIHKSHYHCNCYIRCKICDELSVFNCFDIIKMKRMEFLPPPKRSMWVLDRLLWASKRKIPQSICDKCKTRFVCYTDGDRK